MNWYAYAGNNPVVWVDPAGLLTAQEAYDWYTGGMGGASDWIDNALLGGATQNFGNTAGRWDFGCASTGQLVGAAANWGDALSSIATLRPGRAVVLNAGRRGGRRHVAAVIRLARRLERGYDIISGGGGPEQHRPTPGGQKPYRYPDIWARHKKTGQDIYINVGRLNRRGTGPVGREREALEDLASTGVPVWFVPF